uniref:Myb-like domain-containing protein n=1 Tax=Quercus lobata TaxID=97700 RepID=A0A7N2KV44_QUELO
MDKRPRKQAKTRCSTSEEVSSIEWDFIKMTEQEEDLICRMYRLVGDSGGGGDNGLRSRFVFTMVAGWDLIAGRIPGRKPEDIERFWIMRHGEVFAEKRNKHRTKNS